MKARRPLAWFAAGGCAAFLLAVLLVGVGTAAWYYTRPPVPPAAVPAGPAAADLTPRATLQSIAATIPDYTIMTPEQGAACAAAFAQALAADEAGRLAPAEYEQLIDLWAATLADNAVTEAEVAHLQRTAAAAAVD